MRLLGIDFETTGLDTKTCSVIEIGLAVLDTDFMAVTTCYNFLTGSSKDEELPEEITEITGITSLMRYRYGLLPLDIAEELKYEINYADFLVAHNAFGFEDPILKRILKSLNMDGKIVVPPWIDTMIDVPYRTSGSRALNYLAADHGFLNPFPHRALFDVITMFRILCEYDLTEIFERAKTPLLWIRADVSFETNSKAKSRNYRWDPVNKFWVKAIRSYDLSQEIRECEFTVNSLPGFVMGEKYK